MRQQTESVATGCSFTLKRIYDMTKTLSQLNHTDKYSQHSSVIWTVWLNGWVFVYELSGSGFESRCSYLNFKYRAFFEQGVPWSVWHDKNTQLQLTVYFSIFTKKKKKIQNFFTVEIEICVCLMPQFMLIVVSKQFHEIKLPYFSNECLIFQILFLCKLFINTLRKHQQL